MGTKNISIMDDVYDKLTARKGAHESFSDVIRRTLEGKKDIMEFAGAWKDMSDKDFEELKESVEKLRKSSTDELLRKFKRNNHDLS